MRNTPFLYAMPKKYIFLMGAVLFLIGSILGMSPNIEMLSTIIFTYIYSIVIYICVKAIDEDNFRFILITSMIIILVAVVVNDYLSGMFMILLYFVLWVIYRLQSNHDVSEDMIENGSVLKVFYQTINGKVLILHTVLMIVYMAWYVYQRLGISSSIAF